MTAIGAGPLPSLEGEEEDEKNDEEDANDEHGDIDGIHDELPREADEASDDAEDRRDNVGTSGLEGRGLEHSLGAAELLLESTKGAKAGGAIEDEEEIAETREGIQEREEGGLEDAFRPRDGGDDFHRGDDLLLGNEPLDRRDA